MHTCTDNMKTWMTEIRLKLNDDKTEALLFPFSSSLKPSTVSLPDSITLGSHYITFWFCQEPWNHSWLKAVHEKARHKKSAKLLISSLNALVQSAGFSLKTQPRLLLLPISSHGLTTATVSSWVHLILSSNLSRKLRTLLQDLFSWHPVTTTQHPSWKNCTGFPFQNVLSIKSLYVFQCYKWFWSCLLLWTAAESVDTLRLVLYALLTPACWKSNNANARLMAFAPSLALDPTFGIHSHKTLDTAQPCDLLKPNWKTFLFSQYFHTLLISVPSICQFLIKLISVSF